MGGGAGILGYEVGEEHCKGKDDEHEGEAGAVSGGEGGGGVEPCMTGTSNVEGNQAAREVVDMGVGEWARAENGKVDSSKIT